MDYFIIGAISGATGILLSHPIDTIKSNVQDGRVVKFNPRFLFRGIVPPFFGMGLEKAVVFGTYHNARSMIDRYSDNILINRAVAGGIAGFASSFVVTPIERLKIMSQVGNVNVNNNQSNNNNNNNQNKYTLTKYTGLFRGLSTTFTREMPGFAIYFSSYEYMKDSRSKITKLNTLDHFVMGGISGFLAWFFIYPQDLVKTQIQASLNPVSYRSIVNKIYTNHGIKGFFRGFSLALLRAVPLHSGTFAMFEFLSNLNRNLNINKN